MPHTMVFVHPKSDAFGSFPDEFTIAARVDGESRESQAASIGEAVLSAQVKATEYGDLSLMPHFHFVVFFATILQDDA